MVVGFEEAGLVAHIPGPLKQAFRVHPTEASDTVRQDKGRDQQDDLLEKFIRSTSPDRLMAESVLLW